MGCIIMKINHYILGGFLSFLAVAAMPEAWAWGVNYDTRKGVPSKESASSKS